MSRRFLDEFDDIYDDCSVYGCRDLYPSYRKVTRKVAVPCTRRITVPVTKTKVVPTTKLKTVKTKRLVRVPGYKTVKKHYTVVEERPAVRWKTKCIRVPEEYTKPVRVHKTKRVRVPTTRLKSVDDYDVISVPSTKVVKERGYKSVKVKDTKLISVSDYEPVYGCLSDDSLCDCYSPTTYYDDLDAICRSRSKRTGSGYYDGYSEGYYDAIRTSR